MKHSEGQDELQGSNHAISELNHTRKILRGCQWRDALLLTTAAGCMCMLSAGAATSPPAELTVPISTASEAGATSITAPPPQKANLPAKAVDPTSQAKQDKPPFPIAGSVSRSIQKLTGLNWLGCKIAAKVVRSKIEHQVGGKVRVKVESYSLTDLLSGKIRSVDLQLSDGKVAGLSLGQLQVASKNPIWFDTGRNGHRAGLRSPVLLNISARLTHNDISSALQSPKIAGSLRGLKLDLPGLGAQQLRVIDPRVELANGTIKIEALLITEGAPAETGVPIVITGRPTIDGSRIGLTDMTVSSPDIVDPEQFAKFAQELLNPIVDLGRYDRLDHAFRLSAIDVQKSSVEGVGSLLLAPKQRPTDQLVQAQH